MKICSLTILHYGIDYLPYALGAVYDVVDECHIFYTPTPSHGSQTDLPAPETREALLQSAFEYNPDNKIIWYDTENIKHEGQHRDAALAAVARSGADLVVVLDADEIWRGDELKHHIGHVWRGNKARNYLVNMLHFWRSFNYVCRDDGWPVRIIDLRHDENTVEYLPRENGQAFHFGYAIRDEIMRYKWLIHGHKNEMRKDWIEEKWFSWSATIDDVHPTNENNFWMPEPFDRYELPHLMRSHKFYNLDMIR